jgi:hypothetical protein
MPMTKEQILAEARALGASERGEVAEELLLSITAEDRQRIDAAWLDEVRRREQAFARGEMKSHPVEEVIERVRARDRR